MPNLSAAKKSLRSDERKRVYNLRRKNTMKRLVKEFESLVKDDKKAEATEKMPLIQKAIDKAAKRGVLKPNTAARRKSRLARLIAVESK